MDPELNRRSFIGGGFATGAFLGIPRIAEHLPRSEPTLPSFPQQDPARVREVVGVSHGNFDRVRELVDASPALAKANWDWGFGDWESALGAAAHTGNAEIARYLIDNGARPTIFSSAMLGELAVIQAMVTASPGVQRIPGPHGIPLLPHARSGGDAARDVVAFLEELGDAELRPRSVPLTDHQPYLGTYRFGPDALDQLEVYEDRDRLWLRRVEQAGRGITHVGDQAFYPAGAAAVRIRFIVEGGMATSLEVYDPDLIVRAVRI
jgi:hypothetical protein